MRKIEIERYKKSIKKYKYVSFDIFDTLIKRNIPEPTALFYIVQKKYNEISNTNLKNWKEIRVNAEKVAREQSNQEEITLDEIYEKIIIKGIDLEKIKKIELETEIELCEKNKIIYELYKYCKSQNKKIIITSDMYLPKTVIEDILCKNDYTYDKLFLSSEINKTKSTGNLYKYILEKLNIQKKEIIHIGDNKKSDFIKAKRIGINAILIKKNSNLRYKNKKDVDYNKKFEYSCIEEFINNHIDMAKEYYWKTGYEIFGPLLYGYVDWLNKQLKQKQYNQIYFLSRDGYIMKKAYDIIDPNNKNKYIYASRRALIVPTIWMYKNLKEIAKNMYISSNETVESFLKRLGLEPKEYLELIKKYNYTLEQTISYKQIENNKIEFYREIENDVYENSKKEYINLLNYYKGVGFEGNVAIIDIGWFGNMQNALENLKKTSKLNVNIDGYYVGIIPDSKNQLRYNMKGYLFEKGRIELQDKKNYFNSIFEMMFLAHHGSVKKYTDQINGVEFYPYEYENTDTNENLKKFQEGALQFVTDFSKCNLKKYINYDENIAMYNLIEFGNRPKKEDIVHFGKMQFYDEYFLKINNAKSFIYYIFHFNKFIEDYKKSLWKPAFLKNVFKINLPYYDILQALKRRK